MASNKQEVTLGAKFSSFTELSDTINEYEESNFIKLYKKDSRTIESFKKRCPIKAKNLKLELKYHNLHYCCIHGGKDFKSRGKGLKKSRTFLKGCKMNIVISASSCGKFLEIKKLTEEHNHETNKLAYINLPQKRKLDNETKQKAIKLLNMQVKRKMVQELIMKETGKIVLLKDLSNIRTHDMIQRDHSQNAIIKLYHLLNSKKDSTTEILSDTKKKFVGVYYQSQRMKIAFSAYPEMLFIVATYKLNDLKMPLYVLLIKDGNGESEIVGLFLTAKENCSYILKLASIFKKHNPDWNKTKSIMTDKEFTDRSVFSNEFPSAKLLICLFHVLRTFKREINCERLGISIEERYQALEIIEKIIYSRNDVEYLQERSRLHKMNIASVSKYFEENWHGIKNEWVNGLKYSNAMCLLNRTNNQIENIILKIKEVCSKFSSLDKCFKGLLTIINSLDTERDHRLTEILSKRNSLNYNPETILGKYSSLMTPYGFKHLQHQFELKDIESLLKKIDENLYEIERYGESIFITPESCQCLFYKGMTMPCSHIFTVRTLLNLPLYHPSLVHTRWTISHIEQNHLLKLTNVINACQSSEISINDGTVPSGSHSKYQQAFSVCQSLTTLLSEMGTNKFEENLKQLKTIQECWQIDKNVVVEPVHHQNEKETNRALENSINDELTGIAIVCSDTETEDNSDLMEEGSKETDYDIKNHGLENQSFYINEETVFDDNISLNSLKKCDEAKLKAPSKVLKRDRDEEEEMTTFGFPSQKKNIQKLPLSFIEKSPKEKDRVILSWFLSMDLTNKTLNEGIIINEDDIKKGPINLTGACLEEDADIDRVERYFDPSAWDKIKNLLIKKRSQGQSCGSCRRIIDFTSENIVCKCCLERLHFSCANLKSMPKTNWFCMDCMAK